MAKVADFPDKGEKNQKSLLQDDLRQFFPPLFDYAEVLWKRKNLYISAIYINI
ncbi:MULTISPECIES: hypothetical protein [unclassified Symbiopectobacterium]|uniref:hypothetical protein n=1 Tax=unclassified Symbiopectobacterium TaxID=2794573 RepID=UPI0022264B9A|nr:MULTISPECIES: hypothetical protein [unclassified Symbiopectobacterium]MCW2473327.1 hypothetical protein [Candidatus Symbiopectobacterium sp. NZEC151]MCW2484481.1 hypothetical protein [Candidatus Symbiopectobacterium sp. NZEC127]